MRLPIAGRISFAVLLAAATAEAQTAPPTARPTETTTPSTSITVTGCVQSTGQPDVFLLSLTEDEAVKAGLAGIGTDRTQAPAAGGTLQSPATPAHAGAGALGSGQSAVGSSEVGQPGTQATTGTATSAVAAGSTAKGQAGAQTPAAPSSSERADAARGPSAVGVRNATLLLEGPHAARLQNEVGRVVRVTGSIAHADAAGAAREVLNHSGHLEGSATRERTGDATATSGRDESASATSGRREATTGTSGRDEGTTPTSGRDDAATATSGRGDAHPGNAADANAGRTTLSPRFAVESIEATGEACSDKPVLSDEATPAGGDRPQPDAGNPPDADGRY